MTEVAPYVRTPSVAEVNLERAMLGAILNAPGKIDAVAFVEPSDLVDPLSRACLEVLRTAHADGRSLSPPALAPALQACASRDFVHGAMPDVRAWMAGCMLETTGLTDVGLLAAEIVEVSAKRKLEAMSRWLFASALSPAHTAATLAEEVTARLDEVLAGARSVRRQSRASLSDASREFFDAMAAGFSSSSMPSGFDDLDRVLSGGWRRGQFVLIAARPSMGKSTFALSLAMGASKGGAGVHVSSLEMSRSECFARMLCDAAYRPDMPVLAYSDVLAGSSNEEDRDRLARASMFIERRPVMIDDAGAMSLGALAASVRATKRKLEAKGERLGIVVVDHLGKLKASERYAGNKVSETGEISAGLAELAKREDVCVIALSQLSRKVEERSGDKRPGLSDLRNSGDLEQDADVVMFPFREAYYLERERYEVGSEAEANRIRALEVSRDALEVAVAKNRNGPLSTVRFFCHLASGAVRPLSA